MCWRILIFNFSSSTFNNTTQMGKPTRKHKHQTFETTLICQCYNVEFFFAENLPIEPILLNLNPSVVNLKPIFITHSLVFTINQNRKKKVTHHL